jgi:hypothetical protein
VRVTLSESEDSRTPDQRRHQLWAEAAGERGRTDRRARRKLLQKRRPAVTEATRTLRQEQRVGPADKADSIWLRPAFVFTDIQDAQLPGPDPALHPQRKTGLLGAAVREKVLQRPPLGRLVHRGGWAMTLELMALAVGTFRSTPDDRPDWSGIENVVGTPSKAPSWGRLMADPTSPADARRRLVAALGRLDELGLVRLARKRNGRQSWMGWRPLAEDGSRHEFTRADGGLEVPVDFWLNLRSPLT